ncbi:MULTISPECIES: Pr6Pr family membrane protein [unclassified Streptomyces]|uniref:Pr6Pr family membrane protein n=1 Tax=unclassified Streptomyces TaxID=2593676 RepID=UPI00278C0970|nr:MULTISPECIES: Pr6Pr family membrane protein [unclassified Streptomyces]
MNGQRLRRLCACALYLLVAAAAAAGIAIECAHAPRPWRVFTYFTVLVNAAVAVTSALSALRTARRRPPLPTLVTGAVLLSIVVTGLIYHAVLANDSSGFSQTEGISVRGGWLALSNQLLHTVTPIAVPALWLLAAPPGRFRWSFAHQWLAVPLAYFVFALTRGAVISPPDRYPYPFLDVDQHGYAGVLVSAVVIGALFYGLGLLLVAADRHRPAGPLASP